MKNIDVLDLKLYTVHGYEVSSIQCFENENGKSGFDFRIITTTGCPLDISALNTDSKQYLLTLL